MRLSSAQRTWSPSWARKNLVQTLFLNLGFFLLCFFTLPPLPSSAKKVPYFGERLDGFRCYSCVTGSSDWATERCSPMINEDVLRGCGNGTSGCFKWIVSSEMTIRGCGVNFLAEEEDMDEEDVKKFDFDKNEYPHLADMCRNLTHDMNSGKRLRKSTPQNILTILSHSNVNKFEHEKYIELFNQTCQRILKRNENYEFRVRAGLLARRRPPKAGQLKNVKFCKWYDACNAAFVPSLTKCFRLSSFLSLLVLQFISRR